MANSTVLEISVESADAAVSAERGGADRIELCAEARLGGVTPSRELMIATRARLTIPIFAMIRPRAGDFVYSAEEFAAMRAGIEEARQLGVDGLVLGILTAQRHVDLARTRELVEVGEGMPVTFHRAIDEAADFGEAVEAIIAAGARRILTSGGKATALEGAEVIARAVAKVGKRIVIVPGAGINPQNVQEVVRRTKAKEFHSGLSSVLGHGADVTKFEAEVRRLRARLMDGVGE
jgi:copper homeostasis protein